MKNNLILTGGKIVDPTTGYVEEAAVYISDGKIEKIEKEKTSGFSGKNAIDVKGCFICPGLVDMHVHLREPGREDEETIISGAQAAAKGGFTSIVCMPNTEPPLDNLEAIKYVKERALNASVKIYPVGAITIGRKGETLTEMKEMAEGGAVAFSDDGNGLQNNDLMRRALEYVKSCNIPIISHCEYSDLAASGVMNEGLVSTTLGFKGIPSVAEKLMVAREIMLAEFTKGRVHIAHVSTAGSVELIRRAKKASVNITAEVTPHHLALTDESVKSFDTNFKVNPPLRTSKDTEALKQGLKDGTIDAIASDHAPHSIEEKDMEFDYAPFGIIGLETTLSIVISELIEKEILSWPEAIAKLTIVPAKILNLPGPYGLGTEGAFTAGCAADLTIINPTLEWTVKKEDFKSLSHNSPFVGKKLKGKAVMTIVNGEIVHSDLK